MIREVSLLADQVKALMDNAPIAVCVSSADTYEILYANPAGMGDVYAGCGSGGKVLLSGGRF